MNATDQARPSIALIGCGAWGQNHLRVLSELGALRVVCDSDPNMLARAESVVPGVETQRDYENVLVRSDLSGVVIATPAVTHFKLAHRALESGKDVLVEKPMALTPEEGEALVATADASGRILAVGHVLEYHPAVTKLKELISAGVLGRIRYLYANRLNFGRIRTEENALWSFAPHDIALMLRMIGASPIEVASFAGSYMTENVADSTMTCLAFPTGVRGHIYVSWLHPFKEHRFVVVGESQMAVFDDTLPWESKLTLYPHRVDWFEGRVPVAHRAQASAVPLVKQEPLQLEITEFLECIDTRRRPLTDGASGLAVLRVLAAAQASLNRSGRGRLGSGPGSSEAAFVHETAVVDSGARIGDDTRIWHFSHVMAGAVIGRGCTLGQGCFVGNGVKIGDRVKVQNNVSIYDGVELEDDVFCGPSVVFTNVVNPRSEINRKDQFRPTYIRRGATLGANSTIVCGNTVDEYAFVAAGAVVTRDIPAFALVKGCPARLAGWICRCGEKLDFGGRTHATCAACARRYESAGDGLIRPA